MVFEKLKIINVSGGDVLRGLKLNEMAYNGFENYIF